MACILAGYMLVKFIETTFEKIISKLKLIINEKRKEKNLSESIGNTYSYLTYSQLKVVNTLMNGPCKYKNDHSDIITLQQNGYIVKHEKTNNQENIYKINKAAKVKIKKLRKHELELNAKNIAKNPDPIQKELLELYFKDFEYIEEMNKIPHCFYYVAIQLHELNLLEMKTMEHEWLIKFSINRYFSRKLSKILYKKRQRNTYIIINRNFVPHSGASGGGSIGSKRTSTIYT